MLDARQAHDEDWKPQMQQLKDKMDGISKDNSIVADKVLALYLW